MRWERVAAHPPFRSTALSSATSARPFLSPERRLRRQRPVCRYTRVKGGRGAWDAPWSPLVVRTRPLPDRGLRRCGAFGRHLTGEVTVGLSSCRPAAASRQHSGDGIRGIPAAYCPVRSAANLPFIKARGGRRDVVGDAPCGRFSPHALPPGRVVAGRVRANGGLCSACSPLRPRTRATAELGLQDGGVAGAGGTRGVRSPRAGPCLPLG